MEYPLKATRLEITDQLASYVDKKLASLDKLFTHFGSAARLWVELECTTRHHRTGDIYRCELQARIAKKRLVAEATGNNIFEAVDKARDILLQELRVYKEKLEGKTMRAGRRWKSGSGRVA